MKYDEKYPNAKYLEQVAPSIIKGTPGTCTQCNLITFFVEINFQTHICSEECLKKLDEEYFKASNMTTGYPEK
jgi:hypothetical protein